MGQARLENTHPFRRDDSLLAHNGHLPGFEILRPRLRETTSPDLLRSLQGDTDSEHVFLALLSRLRNHGSDGSQATIAGRMRCVLDETVRWLESECDEVEGGPEPVERGPDGHRLDRMAANLLWTVGPELAGSRFGRSLWYVERDGALRCDVCGHKHPDPEPEGYRAIVLASERITDEDWRKVPERSVFRVDERMRLDVTILDA